MIPFPRMTVNDWLAIVDDGLSMSYPLCMRV